MRRYRILGTLGVLGWLLIASSGTAHAGVQSRLLFEVRTNQNAKKLYQFYVLTEGPQKRLVGLRYARKTLMQVATWTGRAGARQRVVKSRYVADLCYPIVFSFAQIRQGMTILRNGKVPPVSENLSRLLQSHRQGESLSASQKSELMAEQSSYCKQFMAHRTGRFVNSIRGYGFTPEGSLDPIKGGHIVVTYLQNGLLNFFRGNYRYVVLQIRKHNGNWKLMTSQGEDASQLFFRTYPLGVSAVELGTRMDRNTKVVPSHFCHRWIDKTRGTCKLSTKDRHALLRMAARISG